MSRLEGSSSPGARMSVSSKTDKLASQQVPRHMRAVSHNPARLPRRLTTAHDRIRQPAYRRVTWLESHVCHAKRFHMTHVWGHAVPTAYR